MECSICKDTIQLAHSLPCNDVFCYICIKRHLIIRSYCPLCFLSPLNSSDLINLEDIKENMLPDIKPSIKAKMNESVLRKLLKMYHLSTTGDYNRMVWRLKEYFLIYSAEKLKDLPKSPTGIAKLVDTNEKLFFKKENEVDPMLLIRCFRKLKEKINERK